RKDLPEGCFDLILCRNLVFTYFSEEIQRTILSMLLSNLRSGGYLVTGAHEKLPEIDHNLRQSGKCIYRKKE
ncbi:MAG: chemotaxis protein CheR, partial [bacterium]|nr:chemotaxis protein CheR [bacterium]